MSRVVIFSSIVVIFAIHHMLLPVNGFDMMILLWNTTLLSTKLPIQSVQCACYFTLRKIKYFSCLKIVVLIQNKCFLTMICYLMIAVRYKLGYIILKLFISSITLLLLLGTCISYIWTERIYKTAILENIVVNLKEMLQFWEKKKHIFTTHSSTIHRARIFFDPKLDLEAIKSGEISITLIINDLLQ